MEGELVKTRKLAFILIIFCSLVLATSQILWKIGAVSMTFDNLFTNYFFWIGILLYGISGLLMMFALKYGELSVIHPFLSLAVVWVVIFTPIFIPSESLSLHNWLGVFSVITGAFLITREAKK